MAKTNKKVASKVTSKVEKEPEAKLVNKPDSPATQLVATDNSEFANFLDTAKFQQLYKAATLFSQTDLIPTQYRGKPANCFVAIQMSVRLGVDPLMFMQNTYVVNGKPGMEAKLAIALINKKGPFKDPVQWEFAGEGATRECSAIGVLRNGATCKATVTMAMVVAEGWIKNAKWKNMPDLMFQYRSAAFLGRLYCPEVLMGMQTLDEIVDVGDKEPITFSEAQTQAQQQIKEDTASQEVAAEFEPDNQDERHDQMGDEVEGVDESFMNEG